MYANYFFWSNLPMNNVKVNFFVRNILSVYFNYFFIYKKFRKRIKVTQITGYTYLSNLYLPDLSGESLRHYSY